MMPNDFQVRSRYGVGTDWPISYEQLEPFYAEAEEIMAIAGPDPSPFPRSTPYPLKAHRLNAFDRALTRAWPGQVFPMPCARPTSSVGSRPRCCASNACKRCPIDSKFTILNGMAAVSSHPRVTVLSNHEVLSLDIEGGVATGVRGRNEKGEFRIRGDLLLLGANAIFNPAILLRTNPHGPDETGRGITEQVSVKAKALTNGLENFDGSTYMTGHGYMLYDGEHRRQRPAALVETRNEPVLRNLKDRWRDVAYFKIIFEDFRRSDNRVTVSGDGPPTVTYNGCSKYAEEGLRASKDLAARVVDKLAVESLEVKGPMPTESHIMCSTPMGADPKTSVVDRHLVHHAYRNVIVGGSSVFPTAAPANPTLTLSALSLWAATKTLG
jgi:choline dehydrogenase-like flavoprotein